MAPVDLLRTVRRLAMETNLVALDVVEVSPPFDVSDNTANNAHRVVMEALAGLAWRRREAAGGQPGLPGLPGGRNAGKARETGQPRKASGEGS